jgi:pentatricopeptide repeat protein
VQKLIQTLPSLPKHQQEIIKSLLNTQGLQKVDEMLKTRQNDQPVEHSSLEQRPKSEYGLAAAALQQHFEILVEEEAMKFDRSFWSSVREFSRMMPGPDDIIPYQFLGELFETAKVLRNPRSRISCLKLVGDILYSYNTVRLDPFNEVVYLDALAFFGNHYKAIEIWKSRRQRDDVKGSIYWLEVGILYYQQGRLLVKAERLALLMKKEFGYIQPRVMIGFLQAYAPAGQKGHVDKWYDELVQCIELNSMKLANANDADETYIQQNEAVSLFNQTKLPTEQDLRDAMSILLRHGHWSQAGGIIDIMSRCGMENSAQDMLKVLDATTRKFARQEKSSRLPARIASNQRTRRLEDNKQLTVVISKLISAYPEVLDNPNFYESWLRGLAGLDMYESAISVVEAMVRRGMKPSSEHLNMLFRVLLSRDQVELALNLLERLERSDEPEYELYPTPTAAMYAHFMQHGARRSQHQFVAQMVERMHSAGLHHSTATFNTLVFYYYRHKMFSDVFELFHRTCDNKLFQFSHVNYRTLWLVFRDYYRTPKASRSVQRPGQSAPDLRKFFGDMVGSPAFKLSLNVYECAIQTFMLSSDYLGACAVLCYIQTANNIRIPSVLAVSVIQLADKLQRGVTFKFSPPSARELLLKDYQEQASVD